MCTDAANSNELNLSEMTIINEFLKIFKDVFGLLTDQKFEFTIDLVPCATAISNAP